MRFQGQADGLVVVHDMLAERHRRELRRLGFAAFVPGLGMSEQRQVGRRLERARIPQRGAAVEAHRPERVRSREALDGVHGNMRARTQFLGRPVGGRFPRRDEPVRVTVSGIAKGVGMIHPRMATMLAVVLTDAAVEPAVLAGLLGPAAARTWNQLSVDGDTSTNDTVVVLASGVAGNAAVEAGSEAARALGAAIEATLDAALARQEKLF